MAPLTAKLTSIAVTGGTIAVEFRGALPGNMLDDGVGVTDRSGGTHSTLRPERHGQCTSPSDSGMRGASLRNAVSAGLSHSPGTDGMTIEGDTDADGTGVAEGVAKEDDCELFLQDTMILSTATSAALSLKLHDRRNGRFHRNFFQRRRRPLFTLVRKKGGLRSRRLRTPST